MVRILRNMFLVGLMVCMGAIIHPAAEIDSQFLDTMTNEKFYRLSARWRDAVINEFIKDSLEGTVQAAFHKAIEPGQEWALVPLIKKGANKDAVDRYGDTALHSAAGCGHSGDHSEIVRVLVEAGANVDIINREGKTALHKATFNRAVGIGRILVEAGAMLDAVDRDGDTALHIAVHRSCVEIVRILVNAGANKDAVNRNGDTALHVAVQNGCVDTVRILVNAGANKDIVNRNGNTPLHMTLEYNDKEIVKILVDAGARVDVVDKDGNTALHLAAKMGEEGVTRVRGHIPSFFERGQYVANRYEEIVKILVGAGARVDVVGSYRYKNTTALDVACHRSSAALSRILIDGCRTQLARQHSIKLYEVLKYEELERLADLALLPQDCIECVTNRLPNRDLGSMARVSKAFKTLAYNEILRRFPGVEEEKFAKFIDRALRHARRNKKPEIVSLLEQAKQEGYAIVERPAASPGEQEEVGLEPRQEGAQITITTLMRRLGFAL